MSRAFGPLASLQILAMPTGIAAIVLAATTLLLWNAEVLTLAQRLAGAAAILAGLWGVSALCTPRAAPALHPGGARV